MTYVLHPCTIRSMEDGDRHYITADALANLYGVPVAGCKVVWCDMYKSIKNYTDHEGNIHLFPNWFGDYTLPTK